MRGHEEAGHNAEERRRQVVARAVMVARGSGQRSSKRLTIVSSRIAQNTPEEGQPCLSLRWRGKECSEE